MKKKLLEIMLIVAVVMIAYYNVHISRDNVKMSNLTLSNVEALANNEWGTYYCQMSPWIWKCKNTVYGTACYCE